MRLVGAVVGRENPRVDLNIATAAGGVNWKWLIRRANTCCSALLSDYLDWISGHPNVELLKAHFELFLVVDKKVAVFARVSDIDEDADEFIAENFALVLLVTTDHLRLRGHRIVLLSEFQERLADQFIRDRPAVVKPQGQQDLELSERIAHRWQAPQRRTKSPPTRGRPTQRMARLSHHWPNF
jgi:hypothetical protein